MLDTSAYSEFMRGHSEIKLALQRAEEVFVNPVVLGELMAGFLRGAHKKKNEGELEVFLSSPRIRIVDVDHATAQRYALIVSFLRSAGTPVPTNDIWIAASAMQHGLRVLTTDAHYQKVVQVIVDHYAPSSG